MSAFDTYRQMRDSTLRNGENARAEEQQNALLAARQQAGAAISSGDYGAGTNALLGAGDINGGLAVQSHQSRMTAAQADAADRARETQQQALIAGAKGLLDYTDPGQRAEAYSSRVRPYLLSVGIPEETLAQITPAHLDDNTLRSIVTQYGGEAPQAYANDRAGPNGSVLRPGPDGSYTPVYTAPVDPLEAEYRQAQIEAMRASAGQREAAAARSRRPAAQPGGGGSPRASSPGASAPSSRPWERSW